MTVVIYSEVQPTTISNNDKDSNTFMIETTQTPPMHQEEPSPNIPTVPGMTNWEVTNHL